MSTAHARCVDLELVLEGLGRITLALGKEVGHLVALAGLVGL